MTHLHNEIVTWCKEQKRVNLAVYNPSEDEILEHVLQIFYNKVGKECSSEELKELRKEGEVRYSKQIPPGYCDAKKAKENTDNNSYGDLILWKQILKYALEKNKDIIFVSHDQKEDWWFKPKGKTIGPRYELRKEFKEKTNQNFYMYTMESFLEIYSNNTGISLDQKVINEVSELQEENQNSNDIDAYLNDRLLVLCSELDQIKRKIRENMKKAEELNHISNFHSPSDSIKLQENQMIQNILLHQLDKKREEIYGLQDLLHKNRPTN